MDALLGLLKGIAPTLATMVAGPLGGAQSVEMLNRLQLVKIKLFSLLKFVEWASMYGFKK